MTTATSPSTPKIAKELWVDKTRLAEMTKHDAPLPDTLEDEQVLLRIDRFSYTTNNITYLGMGNALHYWDYFPATDNWGKPPVWGQATVIASRHPDISEGEQIFGYFPMASHFVATASHVNGLRFFDGAAHRTALADAYPYARTYNHYVRLKSDPSYDAQHADLALLFRPLFYTSFLLVDFVLDNHCFDAAQIVITSASSKTALSAASEFRRQAKTQAIPSVIGLTSAANKGFLEDAGCYDKVVTYDELATLDNSNATVVLDIAGNAGLNQQLVAHFADQLQHLALIGAAHLGDSEVQGKPISEKAEFFFAATQGQKRSQDWGAEGLATRYAEAWHAFIPHAQEWVDMVYLENISDIKKAYLALLRGEANPRHGFIMRLRDDN